MYLYIHISKSIPSLKEFTKQVIFVFVIIFASASSTFKCYVFARSWSHCHSSVDPTVLTALATTAYKL